MEALIKNEDAMDKEVKDRVKDHKRRHDSDDDEDNDDDEGPSAGSNQGRTRKKKLCKADLEGLAFNLFKAFHKNIISLKQSDPKCDISYVSRVKTFKKYGYNYLREIILRRADYKEYKISEKDFKNLHPNDFEDLYLLNIQEQTQPSDKNRTRIHRHTTVIHVDQKLWSSESCGDSACS
ncbi:hypothetical protein Tco_1155435 [Tanacetum coccineum]